MADTVTGFRRIRDRMRARAFVVHEVPHWEGRGKGTLRPGGKVNHHTAGGRAGGNTASLRLVTFGREGLRNALCNWYEARNGDLWIVAALTAWHAGAGGWQGLSGNSRVIGLEAENDGLEEPWSARMLDAAAALDVECVREFGYGVGMIPEHKEWTSRKPDRRGIDGRAWRDRVAAGLHTVHVQTVTPPPLLEEDEPMITIDVQPGREQVLWIEPTDGKGLVPYTSAAIVLTTHRPEHRVQIAAPAVGLGWDPRTITNDPQHPFVHFVRGAGGARLVVRNLDAEHAMGGHVIYRR